MSGASEELFDSRQRPFISYPKLIDGEPRVWGQHSLLLGGNVGSFPVGGEEVGSAVTWHRSRIKTKSQWSYTSICMSRTQFCWKTRYEGRGELQKAHLFHEQVLCYLFSLLLWASGFYRLVLFSVTPRPVVTFRKADRNWNFKGMKFTSDTEICHKPRPTALITSEKFRWEDRSDPTSTHLQVIANTVPGMRYGRTRYLIYLHCCTSSLIEH